MSKISTWSTTADDNNSAVPDGWAESMLPSGVNNTAREGMAQTRVVWNDKEWFEVGDGNGATVVTRTSNTTCTIPTDVTATHHVGRRVKIVAANTGTIYSHISVTNYSAPNTTVTFASGTISSSDSTISLYLGSPYVNPAIPVVDEDAMGSDSAILPPSQQSVKAFVESGTSILTNKRLNSPKINEDVVMSSTSTELNLLDGATVTTAEINYNDTGSSVGTVVASKTVTADANKDVSSFRNITLTGELDAGSLDVSGNADIDGTLETDGLSLNGTTITATGAELNYTDGVTSAIQTQLDAKVVKASNLSDVASASTSRTNLGLGSISTQASNSVSITGGSITGMGSPSGNTDVANKSYVDQAIAGLRDRTVAECASTANVNLSNALEAGDAIDGITLVEGDRVLIKDNTDATENGLYLAVGSGAGAASRDPEHDSISELSGGMIVVNQGSANDNKIFLCTTDSDGSIGSTNIVYTVITPSNSGTVESVGITQSGSEFTIGSTPVTTSGNITLNVNRISATKIGANTNISDTEYGYLNGVTSAIQTQLNTVPIANLDIDGGTDIGEDLTTSDLIVVDNGAGGTNRKSALSRVNTLVQTTGGFPLTALDIDGGTDIGEDIVDADLFIIDNGAGGTNRKTAASRLKTYIGSGTTLVGSTNNTVATVSGANALVGEANLTFDGEVLKVLGDPSTVITQPYNLQLENDTDGATSGDAKTGILFRASYNDTTATDLAGITAGKENTSNGEYGSFISLNTRTNGVNEITERMRIDSAGKVGIGTTGSGGASTGKVSVSYGSGGTMPQTLTADNSYIALGNNEYGDTSTPNGKAMIAFGYTGGTTRTHAPAYIGYEEVLNSGYTKGNLTFYTRDATTDSAPSKAMQINTAGIVTKPLQPAFKIWQSGALSVADGHTLFSTNTTEINDQNSDISGATFTAPVDGFYYMSAYITYESIGSGDTDTIEDQFIFSNGTEVIDRYGKLNTARSAGGYCLSHGSVVSYMDASDTVYCKHNDGGTLAVHPTQSVSHFEGYLLG